MIYGIVRNSDSVVKGVIKSNSAPVNADYTYIELTEQQAANVKAKMQQAVTERGILKYENDQLTITDRPDLLILDCSDPTIESGQTVQITAKMTTGKVGTVTVAGKVIPIDENGLTLTVRYN